MRFSRADAELLARELEADELTASVCRACLTFVSFPLVAGAQGVARAAARRIAPELWAEGLGGPALAALRRARRLGVDRAAEALEEVESVGPASEVVRAIVLRLAAAQADEIGTRSPDSS